jgi:hypothetical protein
MKRAGDAERVFKNLSDFGMKTRILFMNGSEGGWIPAMSQDRMVFSMPEGPACVWMSDKQLPR